ncbi:MAG: hypothetical protein V2I43_26580, partial [Parvularcula sp.]|nr:hypothetical protein [Parvularcula sp.]
MAALLGTILAVLPIAFLGLRWDVPNLIILGICFGAGSIFFVRQRVSWAGIQASVDLGAIRACGVYAGIFAFTLLTFRAGWVLPNHDPLAVPTHAMHILQGDLPIEAYATKTNAYSYPPGLGIILAPLFFVLGPIEGLGAFKLLTIGMIAAMPLTWALLVIRAGDLPIPMWIGGLISFLIFVALGKNIFFIPTYAGKTAFLWVAVILP